MVDGFSGYCPRLTDGRFCGNASKPDNLKKLGILEDIQ